MLTTLGMVKSYKIGSIRSQAPNRAKISSAYGEGSTTRRKWV